MSLVGSAVSFVLFGSARARFSTRYSLTSARTPSSFWPVTRPMPESRCPRGRTRERVLGLLTSAFSAATKLVRETRVVWSISEVDASRRAFCHLKIAREEEKAPYPSPATLGRAT
ncbi:hypothetical protein Rxyl_2235 [Rubrobacter xylanophilus DSM 9941]|uniref:Uncharacterized protein n=1 Tax=Rubrobacter xylanophilus (strain DSM 9941 / JCM 11954 / NBRC 16129 / PRD-1) TaxID=266117 RepID=Q1ATV5_RUBXD|nr:hypothetical protein Rxyl_2235 [Rubrobacter xylanophilus DSM 9941]